MAAYPPLPSRRRLREADGNITSIYSTRVLGRIGISFHGCRSLFPVFRGLSENGYEGCNFYRLSNYGSEKGCPH